MATKKHVFTPLEKKIYSNILKKYMRVIESKGTDGASLRAKNEAWHSVTKEFNASPHAINQATSKQLRRLWMNLKHRQKGVLARERHRRAAFARRLSTSDAVVHPDDAVVAPAFVDVSVPTVAVKEEALSPVSSFYVSSEGPSTSSVYAISGKPQLTRSSIAPPSPTSANNPPVPISVDSSQRLKNYILEKEYRDKQKRAEELHELEMELLREKIREAKANANLAELILFRQQHLGDVSEEGN